MTRVYFKGSHAAFVVFDGAAGDAPKQLESVLSWKKDIDDKVRLPSGDPIPVVMLANKCDLGLQVKDAELDRFCRENEFHAWFPSSAKEGTNLDAAVAMLADKAIANLVRAPPGRIEPFLAAYRAFPCCWCPFWEGGFTNDSVFSFPPRLEFSPLKGTRVCGINKAWQRLDWVC